MRFALLAKPTPQFADRVKTGPAGVRSLCNGCGLLAAKVRFVFTTFASVTLLTSLFAASKGANRTR